ncbi:MAG: peptide transporter, partial [Chitinophagaceae bacterium]|nr:peptide transporter [Chitinophagaceae bacterium]
VVLELCGIKALSFAVGTYLPLATTLPIFIGGFIRGIVDKKAKKDNPDEPVEEDLQKGNLFATGLVAGGALFGVLVAILTVFNESGMKSVNLEEHLTHLFGNNGYMLIGVLMFTIMALILYRIGSAKTEKIKE